MAISSKTILIVGAGFGGITAALKLERQLRNNPSWNIVLIDKNPYQLYTPALYEIAAIPKEEAAPENMKSVIAIPIANIIGKKKIAFLQGELTGMDTKKQIVYTAHGAQAHYDFLILALGSETNYFDIPGLREHALPLKKFEDAVRIRNKVERMLAQRHTLTLVVGGAGMSGIELIGEFSNFIRYLAERTIRDPACHARLVLVEASHAILPGFDPHVRERANKRLATLGVEIHTDSRITSVTPQEILLNNTQTIPYDILVWTGGVMGNPACGTGSFPVTDKKNCAVNEFLEIDSHAFAIGDAAGFIDPRTKALLPWNIPVAEHEARMVTRNIMREIKGKQKRPFYPAQKYPYVLAIGKKYAIADLVFIRFWGFAGWCAKLLVELRYLLFILPFGDAVRIWLKSIRTYTSND
ncbi:MAG: NAD(P)/FAD-dependent oxidoreductase [Candidatus Sungbacteria bacterium]|nr:NAD(P)/FAD-dependent oxidoreductase [Candidatus Sungbacteria bacterium]